MYDAADILHPLIDIEYITNDIFEVNWWETCAIGYAASLLFTDAMMARLAELVDKMPSESW
jgi:hypothetical protein